MKVTRVKIFVGKGNILANMNITLDDCLAVNGIKVIEGSKGRFISFPQTSYKDKAGNTQYRDIVFPCTKEARAALDRVLMKKYEDWRQTAEKYPSPSDMGGR